LTTLAALKSGKIPTWALLTQLPAIVILKLPGKTAKAVVAESEQKIKW